MIAAVAAAADTALSHLATWLETMRSAEGYGGPVAHWWRDSLLYAGPGLDWRYEGIVAGYLNLHERTGQRVWLDKAIRAGNDLLAGQDGAGNFRASTFEQNPRPGGTPHEAAADVALLLLAKSLKEAGAAYADAAIKNLREYYVARLWHDADRRFWDDPETPSFVPNKSATLIEALCLWAEVAGDDEPIERFVRPTADVILEHQRRDGGIAQNTLSGKLIEAYFPYYNARCVPGLLRAAAVLDEPRYAEAACRAMDFVFRQQDPDGGFPQVVYAGGKANRWPRWVAALGDVLRAAELVRSQGLDLRLEATENWLLEGQLASGAFATARGFASQASQRRPRETPDFRDLLGVCGWNDKAFRWLACRSSGTLPAERTQSVDTDCLFFGRRARYFEDSQRVTVTAGERVLYEWRKGQPWAGMHA